MKKIIITIFSLLLLFQTVSCSNNPLTTPNEIVYITGKSAYEIAVENGFKGSEAEWLDSLKGESGDRGKTAYELAVENGFEGSEAEWISSLKGESGENGRSAYELAVENGFKGSFEEWLISLGVDTFNYDINSKAAAFSYLFNNKNNVDSFLFFTDPHLTDVTSAKTQKYINFIEKVYNATPTAFVISGGDWINSNDTQEQACFKLGYINGMMHSRFNKYYPMLGNHDTNYQGILNSEADKNSGQINDGALSSLFFDNGIKTYYTFNSSHARYIVLDTQLDWSTSLNDAAKEQLRWFADELIKNDTPNNIVCMHMIYAITEQKLMTPIVKNFFDIMKAYNEKTSVTLDGVTYDFSKCIGDIAFVLSGHSHDDFYEKIEGIHVVSTTNLESGSIPTFDLVLVDWDNGKVYFTRIGNGQDRIITFN